MDGMSGMELAGRIRRQNHPFPPIIIFITGYPDHMPDAFDVQAYHYLLKPLNYKKFSDVMARAVKEAEYHIKQADEFLIIKADNIMRKVAYDDIIYIESNPYFTQSTTRSRPILP